MSLKLNVTRNRFYLLIIAFLISSCSIWQNRSASEKKLIPADYVIKKTIDGNEVEFQNFEKNVSELESSYSFTTKNIKEELDEIVKLKKHPEEITFKNTFVKFDSVMDSLYTLSVRYHFMKYTHSNEEMRKIASELSLKLEDLEIDINSREDLFDSFNMAEKTILKNNKTILRDVDKRLISETLLGFRRMGFGFSKERRTKITKIFKELSLLSKQGNDNILKGNNNPLYLSMKEVEGLKESVLKNLEFDKEKKSYIVRTGVQFQIKLIIENSPIEATRKKVYAAFEGNAKENEEIFKKIFHKRAVLAELLGYKNWSDYQLEILMIKNSKNAKQFIQELSTKVEGKFREEIKGLENLKQIETKNKFAKLESWDVGYYTKLYQEEYLKVDEEELKKYFTLDNTLSGLIKIYETIFSINMTFVDAPVVLDDEVKTLIVTDKKTNKVLGVIYLDLYPRPENEKYGHFANVSIRLGKQNDDGSYRHPITSLVCNFPKAIGNEPSLLSYYHVKTLFHEFGHALHAILTESPYFRFSGTTVARDFVEAPSQMLENWVKNKEVLDTFAIHYQTKNKIPQEMIDGVLKVENATIALFYRRQFNLAEIDGTLHRQTSKDYLDAYDVVHSLSKKYYLPEPTGSNLVNRFGHLLGGYDARYYGYAYADAVAADLASKFLESKDGFLDKEIGMKLREEIYSKGSTRDEKISIEKFLGRKQSSDAFVKRLTGKK